MVSNIPVKVIGGKKQPQIILQPIDQHVLVDQYAMFVIQADGDGITYQWYIDRNDGNGWKMLDGFVENTCAVSKVNLNENGFRYYCQIADQYGNLIKSNEAALYVTAIPELPQTGDTSMFMLWIIIGIISLIGILIWKKEHNA